MSTLRRLGSDGLEAAAVPAVDLDPSAQLMPHLRLGGMTRVVDLILAANLAELPASVAPVEAATVVEQH